MLVNKGHQVDLEVRIVVRAPQPARVAKLKEADTADRTLLLVQLRQFCFGLAQIQLFGQCSGDRRSRAGSLFLQESSRMLFTQVHHLRTAGLGQLGDVESRWLFAVLAFHDLSSPTHIGRNRRKSVHRNE